jgi:phosphoserine phosphatase
VEAAQRNAALQAEMLALTESQHSCLCLPQRPWKAIFFDMDATVIAEESIVELASAAGKAKEVHELTERAMAGELDFVTALRTRVAMLSGLPLQALHSVTASLTINPGMQALAAAARAKDIKLYLVSGGFKLLASRIVQELGFTGYRANDLEHDGQALTGKLLGPLVDAQGKADFLKEVSQELGIPLSECLAVGDGANDLPMLKLAGASVGYHPKPVLLPVIDGANFHDHSLLVEFLKYS